MKSILLKEYGDADVMYLGDSPLPELKPSEVLVKVEAFAINRADILQRKGKYPSPKGASPLMGLEIAGTVTDANKSAKWKVGDKVFGLLPGGGYAEFAAADEGLLSAIPEGYSFAEAAAIPETFLTAYLALKWLGDLKKGEKVLIHAASGGVGTAAIQLAKQMGAKIFITASTSKHAICKELGADFCIEYKDNDWQADVVKLAEGSTINVIVDFIGAGYFNANIDVLDMDGRLIMLALMGGGDVEKVNLRKIIGKRLKIEGSTLRNRDITYQRALFKDCFDFSLPLFKEQKMKPVIDRTMSWQQIKDAHIRMEENKHIGKIVMETH